MRALLADRTAVVTGAASGLGREISLTFAEHGADVVAADVRETPREGGTPTHERIVADTDADATFVECDVTCVDDLERVVEAADAFGGVDVMVNNAGVSQITDFLDVTEDEYERLMDVNVKGTFFGAQVAARKMVEDGGGSIVNMSSSAGIRGTAASVEYCTSKGAVRLLTYALADRLGPEGVRVNALHPGTTKTEMTRSDLGIVEGDDEDAYAETIPLGRFGDPTDVADAALFLASDRAGYVNGASLPVDGGRTSTY